MRNVLTIIFCALFSASFFVCPLAAREDLVQAHTEVSLLSEAVSVKPQDVFTVAIRMRMDPDWHVYWFNPGDSGMAPEIRWNLPSGWSAGPIQWPVPKRIDAPPLAAYGYDNEVYFLVDITTSVETPFETDVSISADIRWLACRVDCIPGGGVLKQLIRVSAQTKLSAELAKVFSDARAQLPKAQTPGDISIIEMAQSWKIILRNGGSFNTAQFFPNRPDFILHADPQIFKPRPDGFTLEMKRSNLLRQVPLRVEGIMKTDQGSFQVNTPVTPADEGNTYSWVLMCSFAFLGGLILNVMPCVLPVLSLKILSFAMHRYSRMESIKHGLIFALGVLVSFWALALILLAIKSASAQIGWGFQFQSPVFVGVMLSIFILLSLNLFGLFEIGTSLVRVGRAAYAFKGLKASFLNGLLATLVATPCTAPFMGTAISYALAQSAAASILVFTFLGLGMALPMILLSIFPELLRFLPKPGLWMDGLKRVMGMLMLLSALWLAWVLALQLNILPKQEINHQSSLNWQRYSPALVDNLQKAGKDYFLDFTAAWCLTCQVNDRVVLQNQKVVDLFKEKDIILVKADWTSYDPDIAQALSQRGRNSIPLYVIYSSKTRKELIIGESITLEGLINTINNLN